MTVFVSAEGIPLSMMTVASFGELGYHVDPDAAEPYDLPDLMAMAVGGELVAQTAPIDEGIVLPSIPIVLPDSSLRTAAS